VVFPVPGVCRMAPQQTLARWQHLTCVWLHADVCLQHASSASDRLTLQHASSASDRLGQGSQIETTSSSSHRKLWRPALGGSSRLAAATMPAVDNVQTPTDCRRRAAGRISHVRGRDPSFQCPYLRVAWSYCEFGDLRKGMQRLGAALRDCVDDGRESTQMSGKP
jgi:hypothetical protein